MQYNNNNNKNNINNNNNTIIQNKIIIIIIANQGSSLVRPTQSRHSVYKRTIWFAPWRGQAPRWLTLVPWQGGRCLA